jgi:hypothetical protein
MSVFVTYLPSKGFISQAISYRSFRENTLFSEIITLLMRLFWSGFFLLIIACNLRKEHFFLFENLQILEKNPQSLIFDVKNNEMIF